MKLLALLSAVAAVNFSARAADPALTIYNQNFAVVRESVSLDLHPGVNEVRFSRTTAQAEPESVQLRDPSGHVALNILEQDYRNDPVSQERMLALFEGQTVNFLVTRGDQEKLVRGKIIRSGYLPPGALQSDPSGDYQEMQRAVLAKTQPLIEVEGELRFALPGLPLFPALPDGSILQPTLNWKIQSEAAVKLDAELGYITGGLAWAADYNVTAAEKDDTLEIVGWVTVKNRSGASFTNARISLLAGDVSKLVRTSTGAMAALLEVAPSTERTKQEGPKITEKPFDDFRLYTIARPTTLLDQQTKQIEMVRVAGVASKRLYIYDGVKIPEDRYGSGSGDYRNDPGYGTQSNTKVWVMREFKNSEANGLGVPLPKGKVRFYRRNGPQLEFVGENLLDHTAREETVKIYTGNAFDITGERVRTSFKGDQDRSWADEAFEIKLRNRKAEMVEVRVVEHLYRGTNWEITEKSNTFLKTEAQTIEFRVQVQPDEEKVVRYSVHYTW